MNASKMAHTLIASENGADATEYALLASLIAVALIAGATALGGKINGLFSQLSGKVNNTF